jgi:hypothetical protein
MTNLKCMYESVSCVSLELKIFEKHDCLGRDSCLLFVIETERSFWSRKKCAFSELLQVKNKAETRSIIKKKCSI